jgi:hypothetical protein
MEAWMPFIIMATFTILTVVLIFAAGALKKSEE